MTRHEHISLTLPDGAHTKLTVFAPRHGADTHPVILFLPALGAPRGYYEPFLQGLADEGYTVYSADLRGMGDHSVQGGPGTDYGYWDHLSIEVPALTAEVRRRHPRVPLFLGGHSLGGQLALLHLALHPADARGLFLLAVSFPYYKTWPWGMRLLTLGFGAYVRLAGMVFGYSPGHWLGFGGKQSARMMADWFHLIRTGQVKLSGCPHDLEAAMPRLTAPVLAISFHKDLYCPPSAVKFTLDKLSGAASRVLYHFLPAELNTPELGHFRWARRPGTLPAFLAQWLRKHS
ncbi:MAG: alpha/beta fold hydrolase [Deltaproteobacteria bacterium]|nr:alpha/beta fold hydrolase [Deltaproteobacteria bacterium]